MVFRISVERNDYISSVVDMRGGLFVMFLIYLFVDFYRQEVDRGVYWKQRPRSKRKSLSGLQDQVLSDELGNAGTVRDRW
jgi:hypothetical protein